MQDILDTVNIWRDSDRPIALATVTKTWGSAPRREGSKMAVTDDLAMIGSVSGGCIEGAVIEEALDGLSNGTGKLLKFGVADETAWDVGLTCGGKIHVFVEPLDAQWWSLAAEAARCNEPITTITVIDGPLTGEKALFDVAGTVRYATSGLDDAHTTTFAQIAKTATQSQQMTWNDTELFVDVQDTRPHLIMIGGVHIAIPLQAIAQTLGFRVSIIDPRTTFASEERFPDVTTVLHTYPDEALPQLGLDKNTYLAVLTHDPKIDDPALIAALPMDVPYVGVLSSSRTHAKRTKRLLEAGISQEQIDRIYTPIGINIGTKTPEEIALAIMAEIIAVKNGVR